MTINVTIAPVLQNLEITNGLVELYTLDCSQIGGSIYYFTPNCNSDGTGIMWQGTLYTPMPIASSGWDLSGSGSQAKPSISISNVNKVLLTAVVTLGDLVGATLTRVRTVGQFLDDGTDPNPNASFPPDVFIIDQKTNHTNEMITWQLSSILDRFMMQLPRRQVLKDRGFPGVSRYR